MADEQDALQMSIEVPKAARRARLWGYFRRYGWWFLGGAIALLLTNLLGLAIPAQIGEAVQAMKEASEGGASLGEAAYQGIVGAGQIIIWLAIGAAIARIFSRILIFNAGRHIEFDVRNELYEKLSRLDPGFYNDMPTGDITSRVTNDVSYIRLLYAIGFLHIINTAVAYVIALRKMVGLDWELTLWCLAPYPFLILGLRVIILALFRQTKIVQAQLAEISNKVQENLAGVAVVKTFNLQDRERESFGELNETFYDEGIKLALIRGALTALTVMVAGAGTLIVIWVGAGEVVAGSLTLGQFVEFNGYVVSLAFPTQAMGWVFSVWHRGQAAFDRVLEILHRDSRLDEPEDPAELPPTDGQAPRGEVRLEGVRFRYRDEDDEVLKGIDLTIPAGATAAIVGKTGSGKSTLMRLLARQWDPDQGRVLLDGVDVRELELRALRSELGLVPQEPFLFSMTDGQNMRFGLDALERDPSLDAGTRRARSWSPRSRASTRPPGSRRPSRSPDSARTSRGSGTGSRPWWASAASRCRAGRSSASRSRGRC